MTGGEVRALALALPGVVERPHMERRAFRARIIFATLPPDEASVNLKLTPEEQELHCARLEGVTPVAGGWGRMGWTTVRLDTIGRADMEILLAAAYRAGS